MNLQTSDFLGILPQLVLSVFGILMLGVGVFIPKSKHKWLAYIGLFGIILGAAANAQLWGQTYSAFGEMVRVDQLSIVLNFIFLTTAAFSLLLTINYSEFVELEFIEFTPLVLLATTGMMLMASAGHLMIIFLGLETMSIALYVMAGFRRDNKYSLEAALKYFLLGSFATGFLLYGIALIYGVVGSSDLKAIMEYFTKNSLDANILSLVGLGLLMVGFGFKVGLVPFHMWTPDVYEGAPAPVTAFVATVSKGAVFGLLLRYFNRPDILLNSSLFTVFSVIAVASMFTGNLLALFQDNVKRILAYSSIAHLGYLLVAFLAGGDLVIPAVTFYLAAYFVTLLGAFGVVIVLSDKNGEADTFSHFKSLAWDRPWIAGVFTAFILSLAGIPLTAGFIGKFYLLSAGVRSSLWFLVIMLVISSAIGLFYYLRIVMVMFQAPGARSRDKAAIISRLAPAGSIMLAVLLSSLLWLGIYPGPLIEIIRQLTISH